MCYSVPRHLPGCTTALSARPKIYARAATPLLNLAESIKSREVRSIVVHGGKQMAAQTALTEGVRSMDVNSFVQMLYRKRPVRPSIET